MKQAIGILLALAWAPGGSPCLGEDAPPASEQIRVRPNVSPTIPAAAREIALDIADAMAAQQLSRAVITGAQGTQHTVIVAFLRCLDEAGIRVALAKPKADATSELFRRVYGKFLSKSGDDTSIPIDPQNACAIIVEHEGDADRGTIVVKAGGPLSLDLKQPYMNKPWVAQGDEIIDDRGAAFLPPAPADAAGITLCVGRSDPCATEDEAAQEARLRLGVAVREAVFSLSEEWSQHRDVDTERPSTDSWLPFRQPTDTFTQSFVRPYGMMYRVYHMSQISRDDLSALGRRARAEAMMQAWLPWFRAAGLVAVTIFVAIAYQLVRQRLRERWQVTLRVMSVAAWLALVAAFVVAL